MNAPFVMPHSLQAETAILGVLMNDNNAFDDLGELQAEHFYRHDHRLIFEAIRMLVMLGRNADVVTVLDRLEVVGKAEDAGGVVYLNALATNAPARRNVARYSEIVREKSLARGLVETSSRVQELVTSDTSKSAAELLDAAQSEFGKLAETTSRKETASIQEAMGRYVDGLDARFHGEAPILGIPTGLSDLDAMLNGGMRRGALISLGARPGMGKSAFGETIACNVADSGYSVAFFSMEMPEAEVVERAIAGWGKVSASVLAAPKGRMTNDDWPRVTHAIQRGASASMFIDDQPGLTLLDVVTKARAIKRKYGLDLLVLDYIQLMTGSEEKRYQQIEAITKGLKILAKQLNMVVLALSQFSREIEKRATPQPKLSDFRDGGSIEQDSDILIGLYREEQDKPDTDNRGTGEAFILKNRQGKTGRVPLTYIGEYMRFENFTGSMTVFQDRAPARKKGFQE